MAAPCGLISLGGLPAAQASAHDLCLCGGLVGFMPQSVSISPSFLLIPAQLPCFFAAGCCTHQCVASERSPQRCEWLLGTGEWQGHACVKQEGHLRMEGAATPLSLERSRQRLKWLMGSCEGYDGVKHRSLFPRIMKRACPYPTYPP